MPTNLSEAATIQPRISQGDKAVTPVFVEEMGGTRSGNTTSHTSLCGETTTEKNGDSAERVTVEGVLLKEQYETLKSMQPTDQSVKVVSDGFTGTTKFDRFSWTQKHDLNSGDFEVDGEELSGPIFTFQLQSREESSE